MMSKDYDVDIECLDDSDREELEHALYSQLHYEPNDKYIDYGDFGFNDIKEFNLSSSTVNESKNTGYGISGLQNKENKTALTTSQFGNASGDEIRPIVISDLTDSVSEDNKKKTKLKSNDLKVNKASGKKSENEEKTESKYMCSLPKKNKTAVISREKAVIESDVESSDSDSIITLSDSDSSSMCGKIFTKDLKPGNIQLNISNKSDISDSDNDICDILSTTDNNSTDDAADCDDKWKISEQDIIGSRPEIFRYYKYDAVKNVRCKNCREKGHLSRDCPKPKVTVCYLCGGRDHLAASCPKPLCYNCSKPGHISSDCQQAQYKWYIKCSRCDMPGHQLENCPDTWRRYHLTTVGEPKPYKVKINPRKFCCNCGSYKHFGYKCNRPPMSSHAQITNPFIVSYDPPVFKTEKKATKKYFNDTEEILEPVIKRKKIELIGKDVKEKSNSKKQNSKTNGKLGSKDPLQNFKKIMKEYKSVKDKNNKKKQKAQKLKNNFQEKSAFVKSAKISNLEDKLFNYRDKKIKPTNKLERHKKNKVEKNGKKRKRAKKGSKNISDFY